MSVNNIQPTVNRINLDNIQSTSKIDPDCVKIKLKAAQSGIQPSSSATISDLNHDCLKELFSYFTLFEWVIVLRVVCKQWHDVLHPMCATMFYVPTPRENDPDKANLPLKQNGNYFFKRFHLLEYITLRYFVKTCLKYTKSSDERNSLLTMDRLYKTFTDDFKQYENYILQCLSLCFEVEGKGLKLGLLHISNYWETKNRDDRKTLLTCISIFGYITDMSTKQFNDTMSKFMVSINEIKCIFEKPNKRNILKWDIIEPKIICRINCRNYAPFRELCPFLQNYFILYNGECPLKFGSQLQSILYQLRPFELLQKVLHPCVRNSPWNKRIHSLQIGVTNREQILQFLLSNIRRIDEMYILSPNKQYFDLIGLLPQISQIDILEFLVIQRVTFNSQTLMNFDTEKMSKNICTPTQRLKNLVLLDVKWIYPADDANDEETRFKTYGIMALNLLAGFAPNLEILCMNSLDASFVEHTKQNLQMFANLKGSLIECE